MSDSAPPPSSAPTSEPPSTQPATPPPLNGALLATARQVLPEMSTVLRPGDPLLDVIYGGRVGDVAGAPAWHYYAERLPDGNGGTKSGGTTCGIFLSYLMGRAGWPRDMINRSPSDPVPGAGFTPGAHVTKIVAGAQRKDRNWYRRPAATLPQQGDGLHIDHPPRPNSDHVGMVLSVSAPRADGTRVVITGDGGADLGWMVRRHERILSADGLTLSLDGVPARVLGWIRADASARPLDASTPIA